MVFVIAKSDSFAAARELIQEQLAETLAGELEEHEVGETSTANQVLSWNWRVPDDIRVDQHRDLVADYRRTVLLEKWPDLEFQLLGRTQSSSRLRG